MIKASQWVTATISLMVMSVLSPGLAQTAQQLVEVCESEEGRILPDQQIVSCSVAIYARPGVDGLALIFYNRGIAYFAKGNLDAAITNFTEAIRLDQKFAIAYYNRGVTYVKKDDYDQSIIELSKAIDLGQKQSAAFHYRVHTWQKATRIMLLLILAKRLTRTRNRPRIITIGQSHTAASAIRRYLRSSTIPRRSDLIREII